MAGVVRPSMTTHTPELGRPKKPGLQRSPHRVNARNLGTPAPDEGYALTLAHHEIARVNFAHDHDRHDVELGVGLVAAKRASLIGRGPTLGDVRAAMAVLGLDRIEVVDARAAAPFAGLAHSYVAQRRFVDAVADDRLVAETPVAGATSGEDGR